MDDSSELTLEQAVEQLNELMHRNRLDIAKGMLARVQPNHPDSIDLMGISVWIDWLEDRPEEAKETIAQILSAEPSHYFARYALALIHEEAEEYAASEEQLLSLLRDNPQDALLFAIYARVMLTTFHFEKAERLANEALRISPDDEAALNVSVISGYINSPGKETEARLHKLMVEHPDQMRTTTRLIQILSDQGKEKEAYQLAKQLVQMQPDHPDFVALATALKVNTHWSMKPMWPMRRFGWGGSIAVWFIVIILLRTELLDTFGIAHLATPIAYGFICYVVYSWVWPSLITRILK